MFKKGILAIIGAKILFFLKPELKIVARNIVIFAIFILLTIYIHSEYINWSEISENNKEKTSGNIGISLWTVDRNF